ncbi:lipoprotein [Spiroplasma sp. AdecLV25b]|uniref:lipoprotein n=1 Tax=Spiroplasma sp. AdecLV25b TaxID=3027162 RepID=UPI0027DF2B37|nr:lipoprotein [Spiroplasma sp. AdecLV25b]
MRKIISLFSAIGLLATSSSTIVACGVGDGTQIKVNLINEPKKQVSNEDPLTNYVYNDSYIFEKPNGIYVALEAYQQLAVDKLRIDEKILKTTNPNDPGQKTVNEFYNSKNYKSGHFYSFEYNNWGTDSLTHPFTFADKNSVPIAAQLVDNDIKKPQFVYWFVTFNSAAQANVAPADPNAVTSIVAPTIDEFTSNNQKIIRQGWIHLDLTMGNFRIDFNIRIDFGFVLYSDKNSQEIVRMDPDTIQYSLGHVDFYHPERTFDDYNGKAGRISDMVISKS